MAANFEEVIVSARVFPNVLALPVSAKIGDLEVQTSVEEIHTDKLEITRHPIERGAAITDHSYKKPAELILKCGWSNSSLAALTGIVTGLFAGGTMSKADYVSGIYSQLLKLQESLEPLSVMSSLRQYDNMLIEDLGVTRDSKTSQVLMVSAHFVDVRIVSTRSSNLPTKTNQANPASTAEVDNAGSKQVTDGFPAPGGTVPPNDW